MIPTITTPLRDTELVTLLDREALRLERENDHSAAILMRLAAERIRMSIRSAARG